MSRTAGHLQTGDGNVRGHVIYSRTLEALQPEVFETPFAARSAGAPDYLAAESCRDNHRGTIHRVTLDDGTSWHVSYCTTCRRLRGPFEPPAEHCLMDEARGWVADCTWRDIVADEIDDLTDDQILAAVERHFIGGWGAFVEAAPGADQGVRPRQDQGSPGEGA